MTAEYDYADMAAQAMADADDADTDNVTPIREVTDSEAALSGVLEFVEQLVDARKLKVYGDMVGKANSAIMMETGQQVQPGPGLPANAAHSNLVGSSDLHLVDQGGDWTPRTVTYGRRLTQAEKDARAQPDLEYWQALTDEMRRRIADLKAGRDPGPQSEMLQTAWPISVEEQAEWAASNALYLERTMGAAEDEFANPEPEPEPVDGEPSSLDNPSPVDVPAAEEDETVDVPFRMIPPPPEKALEPVVEDAQDAPVDEPDAVDRRQIDVRTSRLTDYDEIVVDSDGTFHGVADR